MVNRIKPEREPLGPVEWVLIILLGIIGLIALAQMILPLFEQ